VVPVPDALTLKTQYGHKIKDLDGLREAIGPRPRKKSVIMCHGTFDIVHPGHLRHLMYAKEKADLLIASVTADEHIMKANHRPYVPQELRAANLAALEMVDFVIVDPNPTPIEQMRILQPDFFAKGYEYFANGVPPKTQEELDTLAEYGGEMVFTPGDVVYSSSALIEASPPNLGIEKLLALMDSEDISFDDLRRTLHALAGLKVHVVGDTIVDTYSYCSVLGATAKSPSFSVKHDFSERYAGGAAVVARHMQTVGAEVTFTTVLGNDELRQFVVDDLEKPGIRVSAYVDPTRPTTHKERFIADGQKMLQVDRVDNRSVGPRGLESLTRSIRQTASELVIFSDFRHGIFNRQNIGDLKGAIPPGALKAADSQVSNRWGNILDFTGFDLITPNEREARFALGDQDSVVRPLALELFRRAECHYLILKLGERGLISYRSPGPQPREFFTIDNFVEFLVDPVGAGDALLAYASMAVARTNNIVIASILGAIGAAVVCERQGNTPVSPREVDEKISTLERRARYAHD
jgi:rfaE bifunctional protein kinase chain/domain